MKFSGHDSQALRALEQESERVIAIEQVDQERDLKNELVEQHGTIQRLQEQASEVQSRMENLLHELCVPLTVLRLRTELQIRLVNNGRNLVQAQAEAFDGILRSIDEISKIVDVHSRPPLGDQPIGLTP